MELKRGMRGKLFDIFSADLPVEIIMKTDGAAEYDTCCFGVDGDDKLSDDRYMIFYNCTRSPEGEIACRTENGETVYSADLMKLPEGIKKLVFTVSIDGEGNMGEISGFEARISQQGAEPLVLTLGGADFSQERAIIAVELYLKNEWRYSAVAQGFNGGLSDLLEAYGGEEADAPEEETEQAEEEEPAAFEPAAAEEARADDGTIQPEKPREEEPAEAAPEMAQEKVSLVKLGKDRVSLKKDQRVELRKPNAKPIRLFTVGLGWDPAKSGASIDCDSTVFLCKEGRLVSDDDIVCYYNKRHSSGAVVHKGDNLTGDGEGDDEKIVINLDMMPQEYDRIVIGANIFLSRITRQHFGKLKNCFIRLVDEKGKELCRFTLSDNSEFNKKSAMIFGELVKENGVWVFHAIGEGTKDHSIGKLAKRFRKGK